MHGSAPDIAGQDKANPLAMVLSAAMMCRYGLNLPKARCALWMGVRCGVPGLRGRLPGMWLTSEGKGNKLE